MNTKATGDIGEEIAVTHLKKIGYKILERNVKLGGAEIDVIAKDGDTVVFCEVKTRNNFRYGFPSEAVDRYKCDRYVYAAKLYTVKKRLADVCFRFDVIEITDGEVNHITSAFEERPRRGY